MKVKLSIDGEDITLNKFVEKFLSGTIAGVVDSLRDVKKDWREIEIKISR